MDVFGRVPHAKWIAAAAALCVCNCGGSSTNGSSSGGSSGSGGSAAGSGGAANQDSGAAGSAGHDAGSGGATGGSGGVAGSAGATGGSGGVAGAAGQGAGGADAVCAAEQTQAVCVQCCAHVHSAGAREFAAAAKSCVCPTLCATPCQTTLCASTPSLPQQGSACAQCLHDALAADAGAGCRTQVTTACNAHAECKAFVACPTRAGCSSKP